MHSIIKTASTTLMDTKPQVLCNPNNLRKQTLVNLNKLAEVVRTVFFSSLLPLLFSFPCRHCLLHLPLPVLDLVYWIDPKQMNEYGTSGEDELRRGQAGDQAVSANGPSVDGTIMTDGEIK